MAERLAGASDPPMVVLISSREAPRYGPDSRLRRPWDSSRSASSRARRSPPSSAEPVHAPVPATPLAGGRRSRHCRRMDLLWLGRPAALGAGPGHRLDPRSHAGSSRGHGGPRAVAALSWRRPASAGSWEFRHRRRPGRLGRRHALYVYRGPLIHLLVAYPSGRLSSRLDRAAVALGYAAAVVTPVWRSEIATIVLAVLVVAVCALSYRRAVGPARRARLLALRAAAAVGLVLVGGAAARLAVPVGDASEPSLLALEATLCAVAGGLLAGLLSPSWERAAVTDLVVELGESRSGTLRDELARALGDPSLAVGYWLPNDGEFVDSEGRGCPSRPRLRALGDDDRGRKGADRCACPRRGCTRRSGPPGGSLSGGPARGRECASPGRGAWPARRARASRRRILDVGDDERRRLERRLRGRRAAPGAACRAASRSPLRRSLEAGAGIDRIQAQLAQALEELRQLARAPSPCSRRSGARGPLASLQSRPRYGSKS